MLKIAANAGAVVDVINKNVKIPKGLLRELLKKVPKSYIVKGIDGKEYHIGGGNQYIGRL